MSKEYITLEEVKNAIAKTNGDCPVTRLRLVLTDAKDKETSNENARFARIDGSELMVMACVSRLPKWTWIWRLPFVGALERNDNSDFLAKHPAGCTSTSFYQGTSVWLPLQQA